MIVIWEVVAFLSIFIYTHIRTVWHKEERSLNYVFHLSSLFPSPLARHLRAGLRLFLKLIHPFVMEQQAQGSLVKQSGSSCFWEGYFDSHAEKRRSCSWVQNINVSLSRTESYLEVNFASQHPVDGSNFIFICLEDY